MDMLFSIIFSILLIVVCMTLIVLLLAFAINLIEDTEFGDWLLQKIKKKWECEAKMEANDEKTK